MVPLALCRPRASPASYADARNHLVLYAGTGVAGVLPGRLPDTVLFPPSFGDRLAGRRPAPDVVGRRAVAPSGGGLCAYRTVCSFPLGGGDGDAWADRLPLVDALRIALVAAFRWDMLAYQTTGGFGGGGYPRPSAGLWAGRLWSLFVSAHRDSRRAGAGRAPLVLLAGACGRSCRSPTKSQRLFPVGRAGGILLSGGGAGVALSCTDVVSGDCYACPCSTEAILYELEGASCCLVVIFLAAGRRIGHNDRFPSGKNACYWCCLRPGRVGRGGASRGRFRRVGFGGDLLPQSCFVSQWTTT